MNRNVKYQVSEAVKAGDYEAAQVRSVANRNYLRKQADNSGGLQHLAELQQDLKPMINELQLARVEEAKLEDLSSAPLQEESKRLSSLKEKRKIARTDQMAAQINKYQRKRKH
jgi:hypothetical protein